MDDVLNEAAPALVMGSASATGTGLARLDPALRERWLPAADLADPQPCLCEEGRSWPACARCAAPICTVWCFRLRADEGGGTVLTIVHRLTDRLSDPAGFQR